MNKTTKILSNQIENILNNDNIPFLTVRLPLVLKLQDIRRTLHANNVKRFLRG